MKVEDIIGQVLLRLSGGRFTSDSSVHPEDVKLFIPDSINELMGVKIDQEYGVENSIYPNALLVNVYNDISVQVNGRNLAYITFPARPLTVRGAKSVVAIGAMGGNQFTRIKHDEGSLGAFYWKVNKSLISFDIEGMTAVFYNLPTNITQMYVKMIQHIDDIELTDDIFVPSGMESTLIDSVYQKVLSQKINPKDRIIDGNDIS